MQVNCTVLEHIGPNTVEVLEVRTTCETPVAAREHADIGHFMTLVTYIFPVVKQ
jgi:hypothetical protein